ncbi:hypothetical protein CXF86_10900 [Shewanella sp. GutCb]|uniref:hypothetical protein n=1 Tax=Shewanella sp. GutCb TaxID=2058315 RepID=UPI000C7E586A|nr:hypothetical protein [Shewanella sp. GutCb]PKG74792.1 hypothetical protein CXF86_10900 [Shewanella sp. GutCb]
MLEIKAILRFTDTEEVVTLAREPKVEDVIEVRGDDYVIQLVKLDIQGRYIVLINSELKTPKKSRRLNIG